MQEILDQIQRRERLLIVLLLLSYALGFFLWYPTAITNSDESAYLLQAQYFASGRTQAIRTDPLTQVEKISFPSQHPVGTALLMTPLVMVWGWKGAVLLSLAGLLGAVLVTARWLEQEHRSPLFALLILGFPAAQVLGRVGVSDVPSMLLASIGLWSFWRGMDRGPGYWLLSGFLAGAGITLRESNVLLFAVFFFGALMRRDRNVWALIVAGSAGTALRPLSSWLCFGDPFFIKAPAAFSLAAVIQVAPLHFLGLMVFVPAGLWAGLAYRGTRALELRGTVALFTLFYLLYGYSGAESGLLKSLVLGQRFFLPLLPLLVFALAEVVPRWFAWWTHRIAEQRLRALAGLVLSAWLVGLIAVSLAIHPFLARWSAGRGELRRTVEENVDRDAVVLTNLAATRSYLHPLQLRWVPLRIDALMPGDVWRLLEQHGELQLILISRSDSQYWREESRKRLEFVDSLGDAAALRFKKRTANDEVLRIWRVAKP